MEDAVSLVFWHELFHAFHIKGLKKRSIKISGKHTNIVMESLAEAFEYIMSLQIFGSSSSSRYILDECRIHSTKEWPYSGMVKIVESKTPYDLIKKIFNTSLSDMDLACLAILALENQNMLKNFLDDED